MNKNNIKTMLVSPFMNGDWIDEIACLDGDTLNVNEALSIIDKYIDEDRAEIERLKKQLAEHKNSILDKAAEEIKDTPHLVAANARLNYHEKVAEGLKALINNEVALEKFSKTLHELQQSRKELNLLKDEYSHTKQAPDMIKLGAQITAKEMSITGKKAYIKGSILM